MMGGTPEVFLADVKIHAIDRAGFYAHIARAIESGRGGIINNVNIQAMNISWNDPEFRAILNQSDLVFLDGYGVKLGAWLLGKQLGDRLTVADWMDDVIDLCVKHQWPVFLLGDTDEVGEAFENTMKTTHPGLIFAGHHHGFFAKSGPESDAVIRQINDSGAKLLLVGMSMPIQEKWVWANRDRLAPPVRMAVGAAARFMTGHIRRGPAWMTDNGLEWLHRLVMQPRHLWRRYIIGNPLFLLHLLGWAWFGLKPKSRDHA